MVWQHLLGIWLREAVTAEMTRQAAAVASANRASGVDASSECPQVAAIAALEMELGGLFDRLERRRTTLADGLKFHLGQLDARPIALCESGIGQARAARATHAVIDAYQPRVLISLGFAGGLSADLRRGDLLLANEVGSTTGEVVPLAWSPRPDAQPPRFRLHVGKLLTVDRAVREPAEKAALGATHAALAVDMETLAVAKVCRDRGVPLFSVRAVTDAVDDRLPEELDHLLEQRSTAGRLGAAVGAIFKRPSAIKDLYSLRENAVVATDRLCEFCRAFVAELAPALDARGAEDAAATSPPSDARSSEDAALRPTPPT